MKVIVDWMLGWGNDPKFVIDSRHILHWPAQDDPRWEQRSGIHLYDEGTFAHYFYNDMTGKPTEGYGGRRLTGTFKDGTTFSYKGAWSSRAGVVNKYFPESKVVDVVTTDMLVAALRADVLIDWWRQNKPIWGLAWVTDEQGESVLQPTKDGALKNDCDDYTVEHLTRE